MGSEWFLFCFVCFDRPRRGVVWEANGFCFVCFVLTVPGAGLYGKTNGFLIDFGRIFSQRLASSVWRLGSLF
jgi:hypothetical protein